jgi:hypothetical protein
VKTLSEASQFVTNPPQIEKDDPFFAQATRCVILLVPIG